MSVDTEGNKTIDEVEPDENDGKTLADIIADDEPGPEDPVVGYVDEPGPTELDPLLPELSAGGTLTIAHEIQLESKNEPGIEIRVAPIRFKELLQIGRILTGHTRPLDLYAMFRPAMEAQSEEQTEAALTAAFMQVVVTVPHSEGELIDFLRRLIIPVDKMTKREFQLLNEYMGNPNTKDPAFILGQVFANERDSWRELGKVLLQMIPMLARMRQVNSSKSPGPTEST